MPKKGTKVLTKLSDKKSWIRDYAASYRDEEGNFDLRGIAEEMIAQGFYADSVRPGTIMPMIEREVSRWARF